MSNDTTAFIEHDIKWLYLANEVNKAQRNLDGMSNTLMYIAGFKKHQRYGWEGKLVGDTYPKRVNVQDAKAILEASPETKHIQYSGRTNQQFIDSWHGYRQLVRDAQEVLDAHEANYTGWNRFFLVTTSSGHIHKTMACSTCNKGLYATGFAMLPSLSGTDAETAVKALGPALCSVCFPEAPVAWQDVEKVPASIAELLLTAGPLAFEQAMAKRAAKAAAAGPKKKYTYKIVRGRRVRVEVQG